VHDVHGTLRDRQSLVVVKKDDSTVPRQLPSPLPSAASLAAAAATSLLTAAAAVAALRRRREGPRAVAGSDTLELVESEGNDNVE